VPFFLWKGINIPELKINEAIKSKELRVIAPDGVQVGVLELKKALIIANELELDLVEVSPESKPPVARLMDYGKYKYELAQKAKESRKNQVKISVKEIQLKPKIDTNDFKIKLQKSRKFLETGDKVKFTMRFRGREAEHPEFGQRILDNYISELSDIASVESTSKPDGRSITMVLAPSGGKKWNIRLIKVCPKELELVELVSLWEDVLIDHIIN
jgi:translation initiation factor IF-3